MPNAIEEGEHLVRTYRKAVKEVLAHRRERDSHRASLLELQNDETMQLEKRESLMTEEARHIEAHDAAAAQIANQAYDEIFPLLNETIENIRREHQRQGVTLTNLISIAETCEPKMSERSIITLYSKTTVSTEHAQTA